MDCTIPKSVWTNFSSLKSGFGCEFLTTNVTKKTFNKMSLFKYEDEAVRFTLTGIRSTYLKVSFYELVNSGKSFLNCPAGNIPVCKYDGL